MDWIPSTPLDWLQVAVAWLGLSLGLLIGLWMMASYGRRAIRCIECRHLIARGRMPPISGLCDACADLTAQRVTARRAARRRAEWIALGLLAVWPSMAHATAISFDSPTYQIVNTIPTQDLVIGDLTVSTPSPDRLTWTADGFGVTGPNERTFESRLVGLPYEWDEVESTQSITLSWPSLVYVDGLTLSNFFAGETRQGFTFSELAWLRVDGRPPHLLTALWQDGELGLWGLGWLQSLTLDAPGGWQDHDFTVRSVSWHGQQEPPHDVPEPTVTLLLGLGLLVGQLALRRAS